MLFWKDNNIFYSSIIHNSNVISFDIFDTLLVRSVNEPEDVFFLTACNSQVIVSDPAKFVRDRKLAAKTAECMFYEPTIDDIYKALTGYSDDEKRILQEQELFIESIVLHPNPKIIDLYNTCLQEKKKIIAVSDMYLPASFLLQLLHNKGFTAVEKVYVSCEYKANKRDGKLFHFVENDLDLPEKKILHIGDSWKSDFLNPIKNGWRSHHSPKTKKITNEIPETLIIKSVQYHQCDDYYTDLGYSVLGPILFGFCHWLHDELLKKKISSVLFFSRDGKIMKDVFDILYSDPSFQTKYFHISRRAINAVNIKNHCDFDELRNFIEETYTCTIEMFLKRLGLEPGKIEIPECIDIHREFLTSEFWTDNTIRNFYDLYVKEPLIVHSQQQYDYFISYFNKYVPKGDLGVVDIGWRGSMQTRLEEIISSLPSDQVRKIYGYYMGIESEADNRFGYLYKGLNQSERKTIIDGGVGLFETLFLAREGTTLGYRSDKGTIFPVLDDYEITDPELIDNLKKIHKGALMFVKNMSQFKIFDFMNVEPDIYFYPFEKICMRPSNNDLAHLEKIKFNVTENKPLIKKEGLKFYLNHVKRFGTDYHNAPWKIGFLKQNVISWFDWSVFYKIAKKI